MITDKDLVHANLIHYFKAVCELDTCKNRLEELKQRVGVHSPSLDALHGFSKTRDQKLTDYSNEVAKLQDEMKGWEHDRLIYWNVLHLNELDEQDLKFLSLRYKDKLNYDQISKAMYYSSKQHAHRKDNALLDKLSRFI